MATVAIGATSYTSYVTLAVANEYLDAESWATAWRAEADDDVKGRAIMTATRTLDKLKWLGSKTDEDQALEWPRTGTGLSTALVVDEDTVPQRILDACCVLAGLILAGVDFTSVPSTQSGATKRQKAGSVEIEYFRDIVNLDGNRLPLSAWELVSPFLGGSSNVTGLTVSGVSESSRFSDSNRPLGGYPASDC